MRLPYKKLRINSKFLGKKVPYRWIYQLKTLHSINLFIIYNFFEIQNDSMEKFFGEWMTMELHEKCLLLLLPKILHVVDKQ